jgi:hypothetical protein
MAATNRDRVGGAMGAMSRGSMRQLTHPCVTFAPEISGFALEIGSLAAEVPHRGTWEIRGKF